MPYNVSHMERERLLDLFLDRFDETYKPLLLLSVEPAEPEGRRIRVRAGRVFCAGVSRV